MTRLRLAVAATLAVLPLGLEWPDGSTGAQRPVRLFLVLAAAALGYAASRANAAAARQAVRLGTAALVVSAALAIGARAVPALACVLLALGLATAPVDRFFGRTDPAR